MAVNPAYRKTLEGEGIAQSELAQLQAEDAAQRARLRAAIAAIFGDLGYVPGNYADPFGAAQAGGALAKANPFSTLAQILRQREKTTGDMIANRAARGVVQSGGTGLAQQDIGYDTGLQQYQALRDALEKIGSLSSDYADQARDRFSKYPGIYEDAQGRLLDAGFYPNGSKVGSGRPPAGGGAAGSPGGVPTGVGQGNGPYIGTLPAAPPAAPSPAAPPAGPSPGQGTGPYIGTLPDAPAGPTTAAAPPAASGFMTAPGGRWGSEAERQAAIANNKAWSQQQLAQGKNPWVASPAEVAKSWISYGPASDKLTAQVEKLGASGFMQQQERRRLVPGRNGSRPIRGPMQQLPIRYPRPPSGPLNPAMGRPF